MAEATFTPGPLSPWGIQKLTEIGGFWMIGRSDGQGGPTAYVGNAADARLYSSAPDLYMALKIAELGIQELCNGQHPENECWNTLKTVHSALAKARDDA